MQNGKTVIVDAGHGGKDPGAVFSSVYEKSLNLDIAKRLKKLLTAKGYEVINNVCVVLSNKFDPANCSDEDLVSVVATATGIPSKNVTFIAYEEMQFIDAIEEEVSYKDIVQIVLILIILGLLGFVVFMSLRTKREVEEEEEISVEDLLQSTQQEELENIELEQKSEARKLIESFVEENPEAVATLLRNWLDEDWG